MKLVAMILLVCTSAILFAACAAGPEADPPTGARKTAPTPPAAQASGTVPLPTPQPGTNSGIGVFPTPGPSVAKAATGSSAVDAPALYTAQGCVQCHGGDGKGVMTGTPNFTDKAWQGKRTDSQLTDTIKNGKTPMPGYGSRLTADQVTSLAAYVRTFGK